MTTRTCAALVAAVLASAVALTACKKAEAPAPTPTAAPVEPTPAPTAVPAPAVTVTDLSLGKSVGADKKVQKPTDTFSPRDTIFAAVSTDGSAPSSVIAVKWTFGEGQIVKEDSKTIAPTGPAVTEFSIQKPKGWPKGNYKVEVTVDGKPGPSKTFKVQ
jgi:multidrug efflux pump subunit AcrA (membrane-fusion protein)